VFHRVGDVALGADHIDLPLVEMRRSGSLPLAQDTAVQPRLLDLLSSLDPWDLQV